MEEDGVAIDSSPLIALGQWVFWCKVKYTKLWVAQPTGANRVGFFCAGVESGWNLTTSLPTVS